MADRLPAVLRPPVALALAKAVTRIPKPGALPGGARYEPKWDGFRVAVVRDGDTTSVWSRQGKDLTRHFPDLAAAAAEQIPAGYVLDGEAVVWSGDRLDFPSLQQRLTTSRRAVGALVREHPASFVAFDVLAVAGHDARGLPFSDRRALLEELAGHWRPPLNLSPVTIDPATAQRWFEELVSTGVEGLVIKGAAQRYEGGTRSWLKVKHRDTFEVVCAAVTGPLERPSMVVAGLPVNGELRIVGRSTTLHNEQARTLSRQLRPA